MSKIKILYTGFDLLPRWRDAIKNEVFTLASHFSSRVFTIHAPYRSLSPIFKQNDVTSFMLFSRELSKMVVFGVIPKKLEIRGFTHMHIFASDPRVLTNWMGLSSLKKILTLVDSGFNLDKIRNIQKYSDMINKYVNVLVVETQRQRDLAKSIGIDIPIEIIPYGVDISIFKFTPIPSKPFRFLFASTPIRKKQLLSRGIDLLLKAFSHIQNNIRLTLVMREGIQKDIRKMISKYNVEDRIDLLYGTLNMPSIFSQHHACIIPYSSPYGVMDLPHTAIESIAVGRPVIATNVIGLSEYLERYKCGIVCPATVNGLIEAMFRLYNNYHEYQRNCKGIAERVFNKERFINDYARVYKEVINV